MTTGKLPSKRSRGAEHELDAMEIERLVNEIVKGGPDRARYLARNAASEEEAEMALLMGMIHEVGTSAVTMSESRVDAIVAELEEESAEDSWLVRWHREIMVLGTGIGAGGTLWYGLKQLDQIVFSAPANRAAVLLVAVCGALVCLLLEHRAHARGKGFPEVLEARSADEARLGARSGVATDNR